MKIDRYLEISREIERKEKETEEKKRESYTSGNPNVLHNFFRDGEEQGIGAMQNWLSHFLKQVAAVVSYVRNPEVEPSESLASRMGDIRTYAKLGLAIAEDIGRETGLGLSDRGENLSHCPGLLPPFGDYMCELSYGHSGPHAAISLGGHPLRWTSEDEEKHLDVIGLSVKEGYDR